MAFLEELKDALESAQPLERALALTVAHLNAESGTIHLLGEDGVLHLKAAQGIPEVVLQIVQRVPVGKGMAGLAVAQQVGGWPGVAIGGATAGHCRLSRPPLRRYPLSIEKAEGRDGCPRDAAAWSDADVHGNIAGGGGAPTIGSRSLV